MSFEDYRVDEFRLRIFKQLQLLSSVVCLILARILLNAEHAMDIDINALLMGSLSYLGLYGCALWSERHHRLYLISCWTTLSLIGYFLSQYTLLSSPALPWLCTVPLLLIFFLKGHALKISAGLTFSYLFVLIGMLFFDRERGNPTDFIDDTTVIVSAMCALFFSFYLSLSLWTINQRDKNLCIQKSQIDHLTDTYNRGAFDCLAHRKIQKEKTHEHCLAMIDIDNFKYINDTYGHPAGDMVLTRVASEIKSVLREQDLIARYGGEEFVVLFDRINQTEVEQVAQRILESVRRAQIYYQGKVIAVTVSGGSASGQVRAQSHLDAILHAADQRLYAAKQSGKDRFLHCVI